MSGGTVRDCTTCGWSQHCIKARRAHGLIIACPEWKLQTVEKKSVAGGCIYCLPPAALLAADERVRVSMGTNADRRTLRVSTYPHTHLHQSEFLLDFCPKCGRDLRGD